MTVVMTVGKAGVRTLARALGTVLLVAGACWTLVEAAPEPLPERAARAGGFLPADSARMSTDLRADILAAVADAHDLRGSPVERVAARVLDLLTLDFGRSWRDSRPVSAALAQSFGPTLWLWALSLSCAAFFGLAFAVVAARSQGRAVDLALSGLAGLAFAVPPVWLGLATLAAFADGQPWRLLPTEGLASPAAFVLPVLCTALVPVFVVARHARATLVHALRSPWALAARARGASPARVLVVHCLRARAGQLVALLPILAAYLTGVTVVVEEVFGIAGLGALLLDSAQRGDAPVVVGVAVTAAAFIAACSAAAEFIARVADPRIAAQDAESSAELSA